MAAAGNGKYGLLQRIGAETGADDTAETAEKEAALKNLH